MRPRQVLPALPQALPLPFIKLRLCCFVDFQTFSFAISPSISFCAPSASPDRFSPSSIFILQLQRLFKALMFRMQRRVKNKQPTGREESRPQLRDKNGTQKKSRKQIASTNEKKKWPIRAIYIYIYVCVYIYI